MKAYPYHGNITDTENIIYNDFEKRADEFVSSLLRDYTPQSYSRSKVIHDCVWGSVMFYPWELQIMDSPLLQRLRKINQLGLALYTYPSAHHSRFEHTLGVIAVASKMIDSINNGVWYNSYSGFEIRSEHIYMIRMAALLHDVGHCFFSHLSEGIYSEMEQFVELKNSFAIFKSAQAHEILAYIIVNTPSFRKFFNDRTAYPYKGKTAESVRQLLHNIGRMIVGSYVDAYHDSQNNMIRPYYLTEMINGQFDADALDYLRRDSYATGLDLTYNLDRFLYKIRIVEKQELIDGVPVFGQHLTVPASGISTVEEMMYNKQMLTRYIYQHQKVMAVDSLVRDITKGLIDNCRLTHPCDFLYLCDDNIFMLQNNGSDFTLPLAELKASNASDKTISDIVRKISRRNLPKKALVINQQTITALPGKDNCSVLDISTFINSIKHSLREKIYTEAVYINGVLEKNEGGMHKFDMHDIHIAVPKYSLAKDYSSTYILSNDNRFVPISEVVDLNDLANAFANHSWNAYIFADNAILPIVSIAAKRVFEKHGAFFSESAIAQLKHGREVSRLLDLLSSKYGIK